MGHVVRALPRAEAQSTSGSRKVSRNQYRSLCRALAWGPRPSRIFCLGAQSGSMYMAEGDGHHEQGPPLVIDLTDDDAPDEIENIPRNIPNWSAQPAVCQEENSYICSMCGKSVATYHKFMQHQQYHRHHGMYACTVCKRKFNHPSNLQKHQRVHTGEKPYRCVDCGRQFSQSSSLSTHMKIHASLRPYQLL